MRDNMVWWLKLRYRLMPYIYTIAADTHYKSGTMMRGLVMDFPNDEKAKNVKDQYMFGPSFLVAPVYEYKARSRQVYLPSGADWYDFHTGERFKGGATRTIQAPRERMPLFVKAGSVITTGPVTQYVDEKPDAPITVHVYAGANGVANLYEDDGVSNGYQRGEASRIEISYDDKSGVVQIGERAGQYKGMPMKREFRVRVIKPGVSTAADMDASDTSVVYEGKPVTIKL